MTTLSESLFPPSNRRRCSKGRPSYIEPADISVPNEETVLENSESSINESFMYDDNSTSDNFNDEEETGIDLCAFMMENPELAQPSLENPADADVDNSHSKFRVTSCEMDPTPIVLENPVLNPDIKIPNLGLEDSVVSSVVDSNQMSIVPHLDKTEFPAFTEIGSLPKGVNDSVSGKENVIFVNGQKQAAKPFPIPKPRIFKKFSKFKPHAMKDVNKPSFAAKEINKASLALFGKFPLVKCEKLDVEKFIKNNHDIKLVNWPYIPQKKSPKFKTTGNLNKNSLCNKKLNIGKETKVGKPIFKKPNYQQQVVVSQSLLTNTSFKSPYSVNSKAVIIKTNKWEPEITNSISSPFMHVNNTHVQPSSILFNENQPVVREPSKVIRIFSSNTGDANSIVRDIRQPIITNVKNFGDQPNSIRIFRQVISKPAVNSSSIIQQQKAGLLNAPLPVSDNFTVIEPCNYTVIEPYVEREVETMSVDPAIEASMPIPVSVPSVPKLITKPNLTINDNRKTTHYSANRLSQPSSTSGQTSFLAKPVIQISPKNARKSLANKTMLPPMVNYKPINKIEDSPVIEEDFMKLAVLKAQNTVENAIKSAFSSGRKKRNSKSFERKSDALQSTVKESALMGCQAYNTTLNDIIFGCGSLEEDDYIDVENDYADEENIYSSNSMEDKISEHSDDELKESQSSNLCTKHFTTKFKKKVNFSNTREASKIKLEPPDSDTLTASECGDESNDARKIAHTTGFKANKKQRHLIENRQNKSVSKFAQKPKFISSFERHRKTKNKKLRSKFFKRTPKIILALEGQCGKQSVKRKTVSPSKVKLEKNAFHIKSDQSDAVTTEEEKLPSTKSRTVKRSPLKNRSSHRLKMRQQDSVTSEEDTSVKIKVGKQTPAKHRLETKDVVTSEDEALSSKEKLILDLKKISGQSLQKNANSGSKKNPTSVWKKGFSSPNKSLSNEERTPKSTRLKRLKKKNNFPGSECEGLKEQLKVKNVPLKVLFKKPQKAKKPSIPSTTNVMLERSKNAKRNNKLLNSTFRREDETNIPVTNTDEESSNESKIDAVTSDSNSDMMSEDSKKLDNDIERLKEKSVPEEVKEESKMKGELNEKSSTEICGTHNVELAGKVLISAVDTKETKNGVCNDNAENNSKNKELHLNLSEESSNSSETYVEKERGDDTLDQLSLQSEVVENVSENVNSIQLSDREFSKEVNASEGVDYIHPSDASPSIVGSVIKPVNSILEIQEETLCSTEDPSSLDKSTSEPAQKVSVLEEDLDISESDSNSAGFANPVDNDSNSGDFENLLIIDSSSEETVSIPAESITEKNEEAPKSTTEITVENAVNDLNCTETDSESNEKNKERNIHSAETVIEPSDEPFQNIENITESASNSLSVETERAHADGSAKKLTRKKCPKIKISIAKKNLSGNLEKTTDLNNWYISERKDSTDSTVSDMTPEVEVEIQKHNSLEKSKVIDSVEKDEIVIDSKEKDEIIVDSGEKDEIVINSDEIVVDSDEKDVIVVDSNEKEEIAMDSEEKDELVVDTDEEDEIVNSEEKDEIVIGSDENGEPVDSIERIHSKVTGNIITSPEKIIVVDSPVKNKHNLSVKDKLDKSVKDKHNSPGKETVSSEKSVVFDSPVKSKCNSLVKGKVDSPIKSKHNSPVKSKHNSPVKDKLNSPVKDKLNSPVEDTDSSEKITVVDSPEAIVAVDAPVKAKLIVSSKKVKIVNSEEKEKLISSSLSSKDESLDTCPTKKLNADDQEEIDVTTVDSSCSSQDESVTKATDTVTKKGRPKKKNFGKYSPENTKPDKKVSTPEIKSVIKGKSQMDSPNESNKKKRYSPDLVVVPFKFGWMREVVSRGTETQKKIRADVYYFSPEGVKLRSMPEISNYLSKLKDCELTLQNFTFSKEAIYREPFEIERNAKQKSTILSPAMKKGKVHIKKENVSDFTPPTSTKSTPSKIASKVGKKKKAESFDVSPSPKKHKSNKNTPEVTTPSRPLRTIIKKVPFDNSEEKTQASNSALETRARTSSYIIKKEISSPNEEEPLESNLKVTSSTKRQISASTNKKDSSGIAKRAKIKYTVSKKSEMLMPRPCTFRCIADKHEKPVLQCSICLCLFHSKCLPPFPRDTRFIFACKPCTTFQISKYKIVGKGTNSPQFVLNDIERNLDDVMEFPPDFDTSLLFPKISLGEETYDDDIQILERLPSPPPLKKAPDAKISLPSVIDLTDIPCPPLKPAPTFEKSCIPLSNSQGLGLPPSFSLEASKPKFSTLHPKEIFANNPATRQPPTVTVVMPMKSSIKSTQKSSLLHLSGMVTTSGPPEESPITVSVPSSTATVITVQKQSTPLSIPNSNTPTPSNSMQLREHLLRMSVPQSTPLIQQPTTYTIPPGRQPTTFTIPPIRQPATFTIPRGTILQTHPNYNRYGLTVPPPVGFRFVGSNSQLPGLFMVTNVSKLQNTNINPSVNVSSSSNSSDVNTMQNSLSASANVPSSSDSPNLNTMQNTLGSSVNVQPSSDSSDVNTVRNTLNSSANVPPSSDSSDANTMQNTLNSSSKVPSSSDRSGVKTMQNTLSSSAKLQPSLTSNVCDLKITKVWSEKTPPSEESSDVSESETDLISPDDPDYDSSSDENETQSSKKSSVETATSSKKPPTSNTSLNVSKPQTQQNSKNLTTKSSVSCASSNVNKPPISLPITLPSGIIKFQNNNGIYSVANNNLLEFKKGFRTYSGASSGGVFKILRRCEVRTVDKGFERKKMCVDKGTSTVPTCSNWDMSHMFMGYECLNLIFKKLNICDLIRVSQVSRSWKYLATQTFLWESVSFQGLRVKDWERCCKTLEAFRTKVIDFRGIKSSITADKGLVCNLHYLQGIKRITFGEVPPSVLSIIGIGIPNLLSLECQFLCSPATESEETRDPLPIFDFASLRHFEKLCDLKIGSPSTKLMPKNDIVTMPPLLNLQQISLTSFQFKWPSQLMYLLKDLPQLVVLELGDCKDFKPEAYKLLGSLKSLKKLRLENGGSTKPCGLSKGLSKLKTLEDLELMNFKIPENFSLALEKLECLNNFSVWPDTRSEGSKVHYNTFNALNYVKELKYLCWGIIAEGDIPRELLIKNSETEEVEKLTFSELFERVVNLLPMTKVEFKCCIRSSWAEFCNLRK